MKPKSSRFGRIYIIWGNKGSRFPFCNSIFIDNKKKTVIDPASDPKILSSLEKNGVSCVINSHFHFDHIRFNYLFENAEIIVNELDRKAFSNKYDFCVKYGAKRILGEDFIHMIIDVMENGIEYNMDKKNFTFNKDFYRSIGKIHTTYKGDEAISLGDEIVEIINVPGHSDSMCCFNFPSESLCYVSDYNVLTEWGPWYGGEDSDIKSLIESAKKLKKIDANFFVTAHDQTVISKPQFFDLLDKFLSIIDQRCETIYSYVNNGTDFSELENVGIFYDKKYFHNQWIRVWESMMLIKHLEYMNLEHLIPDPISGKV